MIDVLVNINGKNDSMEVTNLMVTSIAGQILVITEDEHTGYFNIKIQ